MLADDPEQMAASPVILAVGQVTVKLRVARVGVALPGEQPVWSGEMRGLIFIVELQAVAGTL